MPLFNKDTAKAKLVVYFDDKPCFARLSFENTSLKRAVENFETAIQKQQFGKTSLQNYKTAIIYDNRTKKEIVKYVRGLRKL